MRSRTLLGMLMVLALVGVLAFLPLFSGAQPAHAATITVDTTADELNADGDCSLREAIQAANTDAAVDACTGGSGADTIVVSAGTHTLSIPGAGEDANATGDLDITTDLTINGAGATSTIIDGAGLDRVFHILAGTVELSGLTIQNGLTPYLGDGAGVLNGGTLTVADSTVTGNSTGGNAQGGGIANEGTLTLNGSTVNGNTASDGGGGMENYSTGSMTVVNSTVSGNTGGGILDYFSHLTVVNSTVSGNAGGYWAGGISTAGGTSILNSTVTNNSGDGIWNFGAAGLKNTIVADNTPADCRLAAGSGGHNLDSDGTCGLTAPGDLPNTHPVLGPLADNGGPTQTHALLPGSPAFDHGSSDCPPPDSDQRGVARPQGAACDIGAYEASPAVGGTAEDAQPQAEAASSANGSSRPNAAVLWGLGAGGALVVAMGAWYVRRRWVSLGG